MNKLIFLAIIFLNSFQLIDAEICPPVCMIFCENGNVLDANGCPTCKCNPAPICKPVLCEIACPNGLVKGKDGCEICACAPVDCEPVTCKIFCEYGWKKDKFGCDICECKEKPVSLCDGRVCPDGFYCKENAGDCPEFTNPERPCPKKKWTCAKICPVFRCMECKSGYVIDKFGCETCQCKDPCERNDCVSGEKCMPAVTASRYKCIPACSCPKVPNKLPRCVNIWNPCAAGCARGSRCCKDESGCNSCFKCN